MSEPIILQKDTSCVTIHQEDRRLDINGKVVPAGDYRVEEIRQLVPNEAKD